MAVFDPDLQPSSDRGHLLTEQSNRRSSRLDQLDTLALVELFADEDRRPQEAVAAVAPALAQAVDSVAERLRAGGARQRNQPVSYTHLTLPTIA